MATKVINNNRQEELEYFSTHTALALRLKQYGNVYIRQLYLHALPITMAEARQWNVAAIK